MKLAHTLPMLGVFTLGASLLPGAHAQITLPSRAVLLPDSGTREINVAGSFFFDGDKPYALAGSYGYFTSPSIELGGTASIAGANHSKSLTTAGIFGDYYFRGGALQVSPLNSHVLPPSELNTAYQGLLHQKETYLGVVLDWENNPAPPVLEG